MTIDKDDGNAYVAAWVTRSYQQYETAELMADQDLLVQYYLSVMRLFETQKQHQLVIDFAFAALSAVNTLAEPIAGDQTVFIYYYFFIFLFLFFIFLLIFCYLLFSFFIINFLYFLFNLLFILFYLLFIFYFLLLSLILFLFVFSSLLLLTFFLFFQFFQIFTIF